jgi:hypothetical protein
VYTSLSSRPSIDTNWNRHPVLYYSYACDALAEVALRGAGTGNLAWLSAGPVHLGAGSLPVRIEAAGDATVDAFLLFTNSSAATPDALFEAAGPPAEVAYVRLDPTRYRVRVRTERRALLALAETYDPLWVASAPSLQSASLPLCGIINGFALEEAGTYELTVQFQPQQAARLGSLVTAAAVIATGPLLLAISRRRKRRDDVPSL